VGLLREEQGGWGAEESKLGIRQALACGTAVCYNLAREKHLRQAEGDVIMKALAVTYPDNFELAVSTTSAEFEAQVRLMAALKMFELGKLSSGKAAELAGMLRVEFFEMCGRYRVSIINYSPEDLESELQQDAETLDKVQA